MGSLYKRGETYWIKYYQNGKCFRESSKSTSKMVAKNMLARKEGEIAQGLVPSIQFDKVIFDELSCEYLIDYKINKKKSLNRAQQIVKHLEEEFEGTRIPEITTPRVQGYVANRMKWQCKECNSSFHVGGKLECPECGCENLKKGAASATINRELSALRRILNLGAKQTPPKVQRVPYIPMLKENNVRKGFFEFNQFVVLRDELPEYLKEFVTFGFKIGWRHQEIASLTWSDVDLKNGIVTLKVGETKNSEARTVYLDKELKAMFQSKWDNKMQNSVAIQFVFPSPIGSGKIVNFRRAWNAACRKLGLGYGYKLSEKYTQKWQGKLPAGPMFHDFRRTAIRNMIRAGTPEKVAMMISGHKTRSVFDRYNIVNDADLKLATQRQEAYLKTQMGTI